MSGAYYGRYSGSDMVLGRLQLSKRLQHTDVFGFPIYVGAGFEMGRVQEDVLPTYLSDKDLGDVEKGSQCLCGSRFDFWSLIFGCWSDKR